MPISGTADADPITTIDFRPAKGLLYGASVRDRIHTIDIVTGAATLASTVATRNFGALGADFDPVTDRLRLMQFSDDFNVRVDVDTGTTILDAPMRYAAVDRNAGINPSVTGLAYSNNVPGATSTTLYGLDFATGALVTQDPPNEGLLNTVGAPGTFSGLGTGFDISALTGIAYGAFTSSLRMDNTQLYTIDLGTGAASLVGTIGDGSLVGYTIAAPARQRVPEPATALLLAAGALAAGCAKRPKQHRPGCNSAGSSA